MGSSFSRGSGGIRMKKLAVIIGGAGFIGQSVAKRFGEDGYAVSLFDRDEQALKSATASLQALGIECHPRVVDALNEEQMKQEADSLYRVIGPAATLVTANGFSPKRNGKRPSTLEVKGEEWRLVMDINLNAVFYSIASFLPQMKDVKSGRIVTISSTAGLVGSQTAGVHYCTAKSAIIGLTKSLAIEFASDGILINSVAPGKIENPNWGDVKSEMERYASTVPLGRLAKADEISEMIQFLASERNTYITGKVITLDGGRTPV